nr:S8 family serine peptidase [Phyllobacterium sp. KW56]
MDGPLVESGNLFPVFGSTVKFETIKNHDCKWSEPFVQERDHANLLAGIIASQANTGFVGIWPNVSFSSFDIVKKDPDLEAHVMNHLSGLNPSLDIYLFASELKVNAGPRGFSNENKRFRTAAGSVIRGFTNIIVTAAPFDSDGPVTLDAKYGNFPQTWGDYDSVIVVSSCEDCRRDLATLSENAAVSESDGSAVKFVHVAAPGGEYITGWINNSSVATTQGGTSQAAASVAAVISSMISAYPLVYKKPVFIKYRIQVCSYPLNAYRDGVDNLDFGKIAAGVVDPKVCMLDPLKTWIKVGHSWKSVDFAAWSKESNFGTHLDPSNILRVVKMPGKLDGEAEWRIYSTRMSDDRREFDAGRGMGAIKQSRDVEISADTKFTTCDGQEYDLLELNDFIKAIDTRPSSCPKTSSIRSNDNALN